ncbi:glycosyltransferase family 39 protein [Candidatus Woesearchaeota archaeon]|nr:glycosyltransferase family 39 protein [Candidatus Woesearchaeota archaeon]
MNWKKFFKNHYLIMIVAAIFLFYRIKVMLNYHSVGFDASIYLGQAKFIYSFGSAGYFEPLRPLVLPIILGIGWILGFDIVVWGKIIELVIATSTLLLVYVIASKLQDKIAGVLSAALLATTPLFFLYSDKILTGIPSAFFALLSLYFLIKEKYRLTGLFAAISFMTRFPQGILLLAYILVFTISFFQAKKKKKVCRNFLEFAVPYAIIVIIYLIFNAIKYRSADTIIEAVFWPFVHGSTTIASSGLWLYSGSLFFYFLELYKQNIFLILCFVFIFYYIYEKRFKQTEFNFLLIAPVLFLAYFTYLEHKEIRFALIFLPYLSMMSSIVLSKIYDYVKNRRKFLVLFFIALLVVIYFKQLPKPSMKEYVGPAVDDICIFMNENKLKQQVILTSPYPLQCLDNKIELNLFSIPLLLNMTRDNPDMLLIFAPETFPCQEDDLDCQEQKTIALNKFQSEYELMYYNDNAEYPIYIFNKPIS